MDGLIDQALGAILLEDREAEFQGAPVADHPWDSPHAFLTLGLGIECKSARRAAVRFNGLAERTRRIFFTLLLNGGGADDTVGSDPDSLQDELETAFRALLYLPSREADGLGDESR
jgi:hypothetical protein